MHFDACEGEGDLPDYEFEGGGGGVDTSFWELVRVGFGGLFIELYLEMEIVDQKGAHLIYSLITL